MSHPFRNIACFSACALLLGLASLLTPPEPAAQVGNLGPGLFTAQAAAGGREAVGVGLWYGGSTFYLDAAPFGATAEEVGYTDVLPRDLRLAGPSVAVSFRNWGLNFGFNAGTAPVEARADVNQTPGNALDDPYVISVRRTSRTAAIILNPLRWLFVGYGVESGTMEFTQVSPAGAGETRKLGFSGSFYSAGLAGGFDPTRGENGLVVTLYAKIPVKPVPFGGAEFGAGFGIYL